MHVGWNICLCLCFFVAQSQLSDVSPNEEFSTSLGVDQSIRITCQPIATVHNTRTGRLGGAKSNLITYTHVFVVKNTRADVVDIKILEQVPLSTDDRIKVQHTYFTGKFSINDNHHSIPGFFLPGCFLFQQAF